jgi:hypothetical protein
VRYGPGVTSLRTLVPATAIGLVLACAPPADDLADGSEDDVCEPFPTNSVAACPEIIGEGFCSEGGVHVDIGTAIAWDHEPPHSGDHFPAWETAGEHTEVVERGFWVHNLEHGWIVLVYNCPSGCDAELDVLRQVLSMRADHDILLTEDPLLEGSRFAAISWTWVHAFDQPVLEDLLCFVDQHYDNSPEIVH